MKQFFKMMFASVLGVFVAIGLITVISVVSLIGMAASLGSESGYSPKPNTVFKIKLDGTLSDNATENPFAVFMGETENVLSLKDLLKSIRIAKDNNNIQGIYLEAKWLNTGSASLEALRRALIDFKESSKFVVAYSDTYTQGAYFLCSVADKVFLNPQGSLNLVGLNSETMFYKGLLNKLGIQMQIFKVGTYKGAVEPFMLDKLSDANREQINSYLNSIWGNITEGIAESRHITVRDINHFANEGFAFATPEKTVECGLVDELKYKPEAEAYVKELAGQSGKNLETADVSKIKKINVVTKEKSNQIAILYAEGEIMPEVTSSPYDTKQLITEKVASELIKLKNNDDVKAVVFRVNSPGGSAFVSEQIWRQVVELKKVKPIVVSMGNVAASGGYYISCAANKIVAEPNTLTGSIGIFGMFPNVTGLFDKLSLTSDIVKTNTYADLGDVSRPMREDEKTLIQSFVERGYDTFISRCAEGRDMTKEAINEIGQGRVWTGEQAKELGLVDELGGMEKAVEMAATLAEISDYSVTNVSTSKDFLKDFLEKQLGEVKMSLVKSVLGDEYEYFTTLKRIKSISGVQARLPYDIKPL
ncbi:signal peptide peptidase SppA [Parabacteroides bouchesdurhonensis]|uniref:signal peptide peptidase SppA n=1 Tax=Parabacteroides bouchesdurhonensis TaxID=1936995 RepID=UPI00164EACCE|nr:signal peptide peptidase SppA [Parabacteroides bouchesdurhonensis]